MWLWGSNQDGRMKRRGAHPLPQIHLHAEQFSQNTTEHWQKIPDNQNHKKGYHVTS